MKTFKTVTTQELAAVVCDGCGLQASAEGDYEFHEFISIAHHCGYGSIHGDGKQIGIDLCQQCFADMCGDSLRRVDDNAISNATEDNEINVSSKLEYSNIFEAICRSKSEALELKNESDLRLAARDILSNKTIENKNELTIALKRVEQLWDAQYQSAEGNKLHQLADLITTYEKKDWDSFFEQEPLTDDDFMPGRLDFKSKFSFDDDKTASGMLSSISINTDFDDAASRDSTIDYTNVHGTNNHLLESILHAQATYPELRFGQLLVNAMKLQEKCSEIFYIGDDELAEKLNLLTSE
jgi:hypothetical protein